MTQVICKGTVLKQTITAVLVPVAQVISLDHSGMESETYESDTLDNALAGIPHAPTGRSEGGSVAGELFLDPALAGHKSLLDLITTPATCVWNIVFADTGHTAWPFTGAGLGFDTTVALKEGLKGKFKIKLSGLPTFPS
jgi:hypothetical protein